MNEERLIDLLNETRRSSDQIGQIANKLLGLFCVSNCPDLTDVWNLAVQLERKGQISVYEMNKVWGALRFLQVNDKCTIAESD